MLGGASVNCYRVDWTGNTALPSALLEGFIYRTSMQYDALNRITQMTYPEDFDGAGSEKTLIPSYNSAGALEKVELDGTDYVSHIAYNAKGQRILAAYGNGIMTRYAYDPLTFRLLRQRTESFTKSSWTYTSAGNVKQDSAHQYDLSGNILQTHDKTTACGIGGSNTLDKDFEYDPLYRLISANGRENSPTITPEWDDTYRSTNNTLTTAYTQKYEYDKLGNITLLNHNGNNSFNRNFNYAPFSTGNLLNSVVAGSNTYNFSYDACGNMLTENASRIFEWDAVDRLRSFRIEASGNITKYTHYLYDAGGKRVKKLVWTQGGNYDSYTYIDGVFEYRTDGVKTQNLLHVMDDQSRIAMRRLGDAFGDSTPDIQYTVENHLGSSLIILDSGGSDINEEEYYPFGETSFGSYALKRYKYCGKERDDESGLYYFGARYYSAWTCRFLSVDPLAKKYASQSSYVHADNNPINNVDYNGEGTDGERDGNSGQKPAVTGNSPSADGSGEKAANATEAKIDLHKLYPDGNIPKPGDSPTDFSHLIGKDEYYIARKVDFELRNPGKEAPSYYKEYGHKYLHEFKYETKENLTPEGKIWLDKALVNLQKAIETKLSSERNGTSKERIELNSEAFTNFAFDSHVKAYEDAGILTLSVMDKVKISLTVEPKDLFSSRGIKQALIVAADQLNTYMNDPLFGLSQAAEAVIKQNEIENEVTKYVLEHVGVPLKNMNIILQPQKLLK